MIKKLGAFVVTEKLQEFLFKWESTSDRLINFRMSETVEHIKINDRHGRQVHFKLESERGNNKYNNLICADVTIADTHILMHGRENTIIWVPPPRRRRRRGQESNAPNSCVVCFLWVVCFLSPSPPPSGWRYSDYRICPAMHQKVCICKCNIRAVEGTRRALGRRA